MPELASTDALGPKLEQHTKISSAQLKCDMHNKVGIWRWGWHDMFSNIFVMLPRLPIYINSPYLFFIFYMFKPHLNIFIDVWEGPHQYNKNKIEPN